MRLALSTRSLRTLAVCVVLAFPLAPAFAYDGIVVKQTFELPTPLTTVGGATIKNVKVGYETIGTLNKAGDNAILIPHFFSGTSHFAGKYQPTDAAPGYWDAIVGPGKPLDTSKYFLIGVDTLANVNVKDGVTVTTGPASLNPETGKPYGMRFPQVQLRDSVNVQKALLDKLGVKKLHAVMGASMGSMQTYEWAAAYPEMVERIIPVIPSAGLNDYTLAKLADLSAAVKLDPKWKNGDYSAGAEPNDGMALALRMLTWMSLAPEWGEAKFGRKWADAAKDPAKDMSNGYAVNAYFNGVGQARGKALDANSLLYTVRANELFALGGKPALAEGLKQIKAKVLLLPTRNDQLLAVDETRKVRDQLQAQGNKVEYFELGGAAGHLNGIFGIAQASDAITRFLAQ
ncbi:homoserine O-acetyltransferase [Pseudogulbenkiania sp. MAI-1]|uniref:E22 family MetX-like putative esterase n=1 Tax=Pseudogulbenkiania sp. MAI-1 TaxID=990370 RepID=UPI0004A2E9A3|nr:homoserine O-acetyltransferase [Pseudogulbenkiania sp. MAI-1]